jgi:hypothetical protein
MQEIEVLRKALDLAAADGNEEAAKDLASRIVALENKGPERSVPQELIRQLGLTGRAVAEFGAEMLAPFANTAALGANAVIAGSEMAGLNEPGGFRFPEQSGAFSRALTSAGVPAPENGLERGVQTAAKIGAGLLSGGAVNNVVQRAVAPGVNTAAGLAPNVVPQGASQQARNLANAQRQGYVVPPADTNPTFLNRSVQGLAGKASANQAASFKNQQVTNRLAARALGLPDDMPVSGEMLINLRQGAGQVYERARSIGTITADDEFRSALNAATSAVRNVKSEFPDLPIDDVGKIIDAINKPSFSSDAAVDAIKVLRTLADDAYKAGKSEVGRAYKSASEAMEGAIERHLKTLASAPRKAAGADGQPLNVRSMWRDFRDARRLIAKTYTVQDAMNPATGNIDARNLANQLGRGRPLEGELLEIAKFSAAHPRAAQVGVPMPGPSVMDWVAGAAGATQNPAFLAWPLVRDAARRGLVSRPGQALANPAGAVPKWAPWPMPAVGPAASAVDD